MKKILLGLSLSLVFSAQAQIAYYDALKLRSTIRWTYTWSPVNGGTQVSITRPFIHPFAQGKHDTVFNSIQYTLDPATTSQPNPKISFTVVGTDKALQTILKQYYKGPNDTNFTTVCNSYSANPYIQPYLDCDKIAAGGINSLSQSITGAASSIGGLDVTNIATGIADFLVERGKEELEVDFFDKLKKGINTEAPEINTLFPNTVVLLNNFDSWEYSNILNNLRESFNKDLHSLLGNIINLDTMDTSSNYSAEANTRIKALKKFLQKPEGKIFLSALEIGNGVVTGAKIPTIIDSLATKNFLGGYTGSVNDIVPNAINFIDIISNSIRSTNINENYVAPDTLIAAMKDPIIRNLFMGLLYQQLENKKVVFGKTKIDSLLVTSINYTTNTITYIQNLLINGKDVSAAMNNLIAGKKKGDKDLSSYWSAIFQSFNQFLKALDNTEVIDPKLTFPPEMQNILNYSTQTLTISQDIASQNYNGALVGVLKVYTDISTQISAQNSKNISTRLAGKNKVLAKNIKDTARLNKNKGLNQDSIRALTANITDLRVKIKDLKDSATDLVNDQRDMNNSALIKNFMKYASFASNVVAAKSAKDVDAAIESVALPSGSYTIKQNSSCNISLNGYIGACFDYNIFVPHPPQSHTQGYGAYAPVGFSFSTSCSAGAFSAFIGLIDVGNLVSYRIMNGADTMKQEFTLSSIISPSAQFIYEVPTTPLSICLGWRSTPNLIFDGKTTFHNINAESVLNVSILLDIPIFTLHNEPRKKTQ
jgi:hypothetical protein